MNLKGVLIDFGYSLAYIDEEEDTKYREEIVSILKEYRYYRTLSELSSFLDNAYRSNRAGEVKDMYEFWKFLLNSMSIPESSPLIRKLEKLMKRYVAKTIRPYDDVILVPSGLKRRYKLALVSNCSTGLSDVIEALDLDPFFECIILSYEVKANKETRQTNISRSVTKA